MSDLPDAVVLANDAAFDGGLISFAPGLSDRASDGIVKASVQHPEVIYRRLL